MSAKKYTKKPVTVEAILWDGTNVAEVEEFVDENVLAWALGENEPVIRTPKGNRTASVGDYIIKEAEGEFCPCRPDIFAMTYDESAPSPSAAPAARIYVASRASVPERAAMWREWRTKGMPIVSTWIDEAGEGETADLGELWQRIDREIANSTALILYIEDGDFPLKGALVEVGMAIARGIPVHVVLRGVSLEPRSLRPLGSWAKLPSVFFRDSLEEAFLFAAPCAPNAAEQVAETGTEETRKWKQSRPYRRERYEDAELPPLDITADDVSRSNLLGYRGTEIHVLESLACRERQLRQALSERDELKGALEKYRTCTCGHSEAAHDEEGCCADMLVGDGIIDACPCAEFRNLWESEATKNYERAEKAEAELSALRSTAVPDAERVSDERLREICCSWEEWSSIGKAARELLAFRSQAQIPQGYVRREVIDEIRDAVLHERYGLAEAGAGSEVINAVLGIIDNCTPPLPAPSPTEEN